MLVLQRQLRVRHVAAILTALCLYGAIAVSLHHAHHQRIAFHLQTATLEAVDSVCLLCQYEAQLISPAVYVASYTVPVREATVCSPAFVAIFPIGFAPLLALLSRGPPFVR
ncbi:MAG: hypothetical protein OHK0029_08720 [Armatimonadaceae bacterium]